MLDLKDFFDELRSADRAATQGCTSTTRAAMRRAEAAILRAINNVKGQLRGHADSAYAHVEKRRLACKSSSEHIELLGAFWDGFNHGWKAEQVTGIDDPDFWQGYDFGRHGQIQPDDSDDGLEITLDLDLEDSDSG